MVRHIWIIMEYAQIGVWGNIPWKYELNPFSGLGGDVRISLDNETATNEQKLEKLERTPLYDPLHSLCSMSIPSPPPFVIVWNLDLWI